MMKILFVEDNVKFAGDLESALRETPHVGAIITVADKKTAVEKLTDEIIDLVVLDLSIPPSPGVDVPSPEHGQAVFYDARRLRPGTPIFILTGSEVDKFSRSLAKHGDQVKLWGADELVETVSFFLKEEVNELLERVAALAETFAKMDAVAINTRGKDLGLTEVQNRMLKVFAYTAECVACDVSLLSGGLSDAKVVKATAVDRLRMHQALCAGKLGSRGVIEAEITAYNTHVRKLSIGAYPSVFCSIEHGIGQNGAIFYTLTDGDTLSLFERLAKDADIGAGVVGSAREALKRWTEASTADMVPIANVRARMIDDSDAAEVERQYGLSSLRELETRLLQASESCIHGDLHCGNVLVKSNGEAVLIDFGDSGPGYTCLDPIALELSLIFHPDAQKLGLHDGLVKNLGDWRDVDKFTNGTKLKPMIEACRNWAHDVGGGDHAVLASAYAYTLRQLKYDTVPSELTLGFLGKLSDWINANP
ncbi:phosphotransferase [Hyphomonas oceanitis]|uniref:Putative two-component response regulator n=1 Tax=Hyphomonas oceanitis SCH89 TaxID=1280953 RepID=A0A059G3C1_9PROT|nr:phosphotransferase [Hyphomonas oceanitis]KDA01065.1 putative two-component response regulator [Hyphomonas oceanitis SCH89]